MPHPLVVCMSGAGSKSGRPFEVFDGVIRYLRIAGGYTQEDFLEGSYNVAADGAPLPYDDSHSTSSLDVVISNVARFVWWARHRYIRRMHLLGWSMGGVALFEAARMLLDSDPSWANSIISIVTVASPLLGCDVDGIDLLGELAAGSVGADLCRRAADEAEKRRVRFDASRLRAAGIRIVTIASEDDAVVTPEDALLPAVGPDPSAYILRPRRRANASSYVESVLGHGALPYDPALWRQVLAAVGPAE
jgi:pimeloyl-ACP methyl ester carboxylesterase